MGGRVVFIPFLSGDYFDLVELFQAGGPEVVLPERLGSSLSASPGLAPKTGRPTSKTSTLSSPFFLFARCIFFGIWQSVSNIAGGRSLAQAYPIPLLHYPACRCRCVHHVFYSPGAGCSSAAHHLSPIWTRDLTTLTVT